MSVAKTYARALFEATKDVMSKGGPSLEKVKGELHDFSDALLASKEAHRILTGPVVSSKDKVAALDAIAKKAGYSDVFTRFLRLLARKGRLGAFKDVTEAFDEVRLEAEGGTLGRLVSADPLETGDVEGLARAFSKKIGKKVEFKVATDPTLLAGTRVTVSGVTYDGTLSSQLRRLRDRFVYGSSEIH